MLSSGNEPDIKVQHLIISLLGRMAFPNDKLVELVTYHSHKPDEILKVYNLCNGEKTVSAIAKKAKVGIPSVSKAIDRWEELGIILKNSKGGEVLPRKLYTIERVKKIG